MYQSFDLVQLQQDNPQAVGKNPFEHQKDAFEKLTNLYSFSNREHKAGILVLPTGAGKTFTSVNWICRNVLPKKVKVLWLAHTGHLLEQAYETFESNLLSVPPQRRSINMRLVSSDSQHSNASQIDPSDDVLIITTQTAISNTEMPALDEQGRPRKTAFEKFLEHSRQTGLFVVLDEAHHAPAYGCRNLLIGGSRFTDGIKQKVSNSHFLGLTATPTYSDARRRSWLWEIFKDRIIYEVDKAMLISRVFSLCHNTFSEIPDRKLLLMTAYMSAWFGNIKTCPKTWLNGWQVIAAEMTISLMTTWTTKENTAKPSSLPTVGFSAYISRKN